MEIKGIASGEVPQPSRPLPAAQQVQLQAQSDAAAMPDPEKQIEQIKSALSSVAQESPSSIDVSVDHDTGHFVLTITNEQSGEVTQIPSQGILNAMRQLDRGVGILFNKTV